MKAKLVASLLCVFLLLSFSGCTKADAINTRAKEWGYFHFPNTDWSMTEDELFAALKKEKSDFTPVDIGGSEEFPRPSYATECTVFGEKLMVRFDFMTTLVSDIPRFNSAHIIYETGFTEKKCQDIMAKLDSHFEKQGIAVTEEWEFTDSETPSETAFYSKQSVAHMTNLPQEIQDAYNKSIRKLYKSGEYKNLPSDDHPEDTDFIKIWDSSLSGVNVVRMSDKDYGTVDISGSSVVSITEYIKYGESE